MKRSTIDPPHPTTPAPRASTMARQERIHVRRVRLNTLGYDSRGVYWGRTVDHVYTTDHELLEGAPVIGIAHAKNYCRAPNHRVAREIFGYRMRQVKVDAERKRRSSV